MIELRLLETALLLGLYVLLAGGYGLAYALARLNGKPGFGPTAIGLFGFHCLVAIGIVFWAPLWPGWKALLIVSSLAIFAIPPLTWRYLERTHGTGSASA